MSSECLPCQPVIERHTDVKSGIQPTLAKHIFSYAKIQQTAAVTWREEVNMHIISVLFAEWQLMFCLQTTIFRCLKLFSVHFLTCSPLCCVSSRQLLFVFIEIFLSFRSHTYSGIVHTWQSQWSGWGRRRTFTYNYIVLCFWPFSLLVPARVRKQREKTC